MPRASSLEAAIHRRIPEVEVELIPSKGGVFEVVVGRPGAKPRLLHSKKATGAFPEEETILRALTR